MNETKTLAELILAEKVAKQEWDQAVQTVKVANDRVGKAHAEWLAAQRAVDTAKNQEKKLKSAAASAH